MPDYLAPGVYLDETPHFPLNITSVPTHITAFIGYTECHQFNGQSVLNTPVRITSLSEFEQYFGGDANHQFDINAAKRSQADDVTLAKQGYCLSQSTPNFLLHRSIRLFFNNGGGECYVVSVGDYHSGIHSSPLLAGLAAIKSEESCSVIAIPDAVALDNVNDCAVVQQALLSQCSQGTHKCFAVLDVFDGDSVTSSTLPNDCVDIFRNSIVGPDLSYAAAYYPWLNTMVINHDELGFGCFNNIVGLKQLLSIELEQRYPSHTIMSRLSLPSQFNRSSRIKSPVKQVIQPVKAQLTQQKQFQSLIDAIVDEDVTTLSSTQSQQQQSLHQALLNTSPFYAAIIKLLTEKLNVLPPSGAICGCYAMVDNSRGVWKAPANIALSSVISACQTLSNEQQQALNVDPTGKSINAIRSFIGQGVMIWGARTLAGNDNEWRYINVRRTAMMIEQSISDGLKALVFEPNDHNLWVKVSSMIESFLSQLWRQGALAGAKPEQAYFINVGLNTSMTCTDIQQGRLIVQLGIAMQRPAEFIVLKIEQKMLVA